MKNEYLNRKVLIATKWSTITELIAKLINPITNIILARLLLPEVFGVVATVTMIISFADIFTDAGFQKYIIQHNFETKKEEEAAINVAFWTNLIISFLLWGIIILFSEVIAELVGHSGLGFVISVAAIQLPLTSFSSIQMAIYRRNLDFKTLFFNRIVGILIPFIVTIPLAILGFGYWSLIIGTLCGTLSNAIILTIKSPWRPCNYYNIHVLKKMSSYSMWSFLEAISIWLTTWADTFIVGSILSSYYLGIYKTSISTVNVIFSLITGASTSIVFSALSRVQDNETQFKKLFLNSQKIIAYLIFPMSIGIFIYKDIVINILLGEQWLEAADVFGVWALTSGIVIPVGHYASEAYRAKGLPKLSLIAQILHLIFLVPLCYIGANRGFICLVYLRSFIRLQFICIHILFLQYIIKIPFRNILNNLFIPFFCSIIMGIFGFYWRRGAQNLYMDLVGIIFCVFCYTFLLLLFKKSRKEIIRVLGTFNKLTKLRISKE